MSNRKRIVVECCVVVVVVDVDEIVVVVVLIFDLNFEMFKRKKNSIANLEDVSEKRKAFRNKAKANNKFVNSNSILYFECNSFEKYRLFALECVIVIVLFDDNIVFESFVLIENEDEFDVNDHYDDEKI